MKSMRKELFSLCGRVIRGARMGKKLGFPTANLDRKMHRKIKLGVPRGVYAGTVTVPGTRKTYRAGIVIGPLDKNGLPKIEAHLLNFSGNLYGKMLCLGAMGYLRPYKIFKSAAALKKQIVSDLKKVRALVVL